MTLGNESRAVRTVVPVPETSSMRGEDLGADDAWRAVRRAGWPMWPVALRRFRSGDGFSHSRALGLQLVLTFIPLVIALVGLSGTLATERAGEVLRRTLIGLAPGESGPLLREVLARPLATGDEGSNLALWVGLLVALVALTTAMGQVERGVNRVYGVDRDRPTAMKYRRAFVLAVLAGLPAMVGFGLLTATADLGDAVEGVYGLDDDVVVAAAVPTGAALLLAAITAMLRRAPNRRQPGWSWLALGTGVALLLWLAFTGLLVGYVMVSGALGRVYGPLTGIVVLLLWAQLTAVAVFYGAAVAAELEIRRARRTGP